VASMASRLAVRVWFALSARRWTEAALCPAGSVWAETAAAGEWCDVPSYALFDALRDAFDPFPGVAEDLGTITSDVHALREHYALPGMVVLQFAFNEDNDRHPYLPENHPENGVAYLGTHDNNTTRGWLEGELDAAARERLARFVALGDDPAGDVAALLDLLMASPARTATTAPLMSDTAACSLRPAARNSPNRRCFSSASILSCVTSSVSAVGENVEKPNS